MAHNTSLPRMAVCLACLVALVAAAGAIGMAWSAAPQVPPSKLTPMTRAPQAEIQKHVDRAWVKTALVDGLLDYWLKN